MLQSLTGNPRLDQKEKVFFMDFKVLNYLRMQEQTLSSHYETSDCWQYLAPVIWNQASKRGISQRPGYYNT